MNAIYFCYISCWFLAIQSRSQQIKRDTSRYQNPTNGWFEENCDFRQRAAKLKLLMIKELTNHRNTDNHKTFAPRQIARLYTPLSKIKPSRSTDHSLSEILGETTRRFCMRDNFRSPGAFFRLCGFISSLTVQFSYYIKCQTYHSCISK